jgi:hypothetical protein
MQDNHAWMVWPETSLSIDDQQEFEKLNVAWKNGRPLRKGMRLTIHGIRFTRHLRFQPLAFIRFILNLRLAVKFRMMIHNFNAGPSILPREVFEEASRAILNFRDTGLSILEIGHRTTLFQSVMDETVQTAKELMKLDAEHEVLFLHGGATTQFFQVPMNLLNENQTAGYLDGGVWG